MQPAHSQVQTRGQGEIILGTPFVVITVTATLSGFDHSVTRAAASLGSNPVNTFLKINSLPIF